MTISLGSKLFFVLIGGGQLNRINLDLNNSSSSLCSSFSLSLMTACNKAKLSLRLCRRLSNGEGGGEGSEAMVLKVKKKSF